MTAAEFTESLMELVETVGADSELGDMFPQLGEVMARSFADAGVLTSNAGLVVRTADGSEFQLTIVKSA